MQSQAVLAKHNFLLVVRVKPLSSLALESACDGAHCEL